MPRCLPSRAWEELDDYELDVYVKSALCNRAQDILVGPGLDKVRGNCKVESRFHSKANTASYFIYNPL